MCGDARDRGDLDRIMAGKRAAMAFLDPPYNATALDMSKAAMKKGDKAECMKHMDEAHKAMGL